MTQLEAQNRDRMDFVKFENEITGVRKNSEVHNLNQAKFGSVKLKQSYQANLQIVVRNYQINNLFLRTLSVVERQQIKEQDLKYTNFLNQVDYFLSIGMLIYKRAQPV